MHGETRTSNARGEQPTGDLARLLDAESRFAALLAAAIRDRDEWIAEARRAAEADQQEFQKNRAAEIARLDERISQEMQARLARLRAEAESLIATWSALDSSQIEGFAERIASRLIGAAPSDTAVAERAP